MRNINQLATAGATGVLLLTAAAQPVRADCDPQARQQFIDSQLRPDTDFNNLVLEPPHPDTMTVSVTEAHQPAETGISNPLVIKCGKRIVAYLGRDNYDSTRLLPAANAQVSEYTAGNKVTPIKNPQRAGLVVRRTLHAQFDSVYGTLGFSDGKMTFGLTP